MKIKFYLLSLILLFITSNYSYSMEANRGKKRALEESYNTSVVTNDITNKNTRKRTLDDEESLMSDELTAAFSTLSLPKQAKQSITSDKDILKRTNTDAQSTDTEQSNEGTSNKQQMIRIPQENTTKKNIYHLYTPDKFANLQAELHKDHSYSEFKNLYRTLKSLESTNFLIERAKALENQNRSQNTDMQISLNQQRINELRKNYDTINTTRKTMRELIKNMPAFKDRSLEYILDLFNRGYIK